MKTKINFVSQSEVKFPTLATIHGNNSRMAIFKNKHSLGVFIAHEDEDFLYTQTNGTFFHPYNKEGEPMCWVPCIAGTTVQFTQE